jgi:ferredoxin-NADP reductase
MPIYKLKLINRRLIAKDTYLFDFEKPEGFQFIPGQYGGFTLMNTHPGEPGTNTRRFSLLSIPDDTQISIATRAQQSTYKQSLNELALGSDIKFAGPTGQFILHEDSSVPAVMIAGGIGITPFYSMIRHAVLQPKPHQLFLFYGNQSQEDAALLSELQQLAREHDCFTLIPTMANPGVSWPGETGFVTHTMIKKYIPDLNQPIFYVCGSPAMVASLHETLLEMGIEKERIKVEDFPGY